MILDYIKATYSEIMLNVSMADSGKLFVRVLIIIVCEMSNKGRYRGNITKYYYITLETTNNFSRAMDMRSSVKLP